MALRAALIGGSLVAHAALVLALGGLRAPAVVSTTAIEVVETREPEPPPPPKVEPLPLPEPAVAHDPPPRARAPKAQPAAAAEAPPPAQGNGVAALPDFGLELGNAGGPGGLAVPAPAAPAPHVVATTAKTLGRGASPRPTSDACDEAPAKPRLLNLPQPAYTEEARAANVAGKVRVEIAVDETGKVVSVRVLTSLGHGLDEAALSAARSATFEPAVRCGRPSRSTFTVSIRFAAS